MSRFYVYAAINAGFVAIGCYLGRPLLSVYIINATAAGLCLSTAVEKHLRRRIG